MKNIIVINLFILLFFSCKNNTNEIENKAKTAQNITSLSDIQIKNAGITFGKMEQKNIS